jgi:hypothetical protein
MDDFPLFMFLSVAVTAALSFAAVIIWTAARQKEREAFYRSETIKKVAESGNAAAAVEFVRETDRIEAARGRAAFRLVGLILLGAGAGLMVFLNAIITEEPIYFVGLIPVLIGAAMLVMAQMSGTTR